MLTKKKKKKKKKIEGKEVMEILTKKGINPLFLSSFIAAAKVCPLKEKFSSVGSSRILTRANWAAFLIQV